MILAWLLHVIYSTVIAYLLAHLFGGLAVWISLFSLVVGAWFGWRHAKKFLSENEDFYAFRFTKGEAGTVEIILAIFIVYAAWRHFVWMLFPIDFSWATLSLNNYGDLPMHINFIRAFANGISFPPQNPIFASELLRYPYGVDLYNALWEQLGVRLQAHLAFVGILSTIASLIFLRSYAGWIGMGAFFLSGGLSGWEVLHGAPLQDFLHAVDWKNLFLAVFITQRGVLIALPIGLFLLLTVRRHLSGERPLKGGQRFVLGVIWGFLPLFHLHAFIAISLLLAASAFEYGGFKAVLAFLRSRMTLVALIPAIGFILFSTHGFQAASVVRWHLGWTSHEGDRLRFLLENFGPWLFVPLMVALYLIFARKRIPADERRRLWIEFAVYSFLFVLFYNLMLAPWEWDNIKLLIWPYLGFARLMWLTFDRGQGSLIGNIERPVFAVVLFFAGVMSICWTLQTPVGLATPIYSFAELASTQGALKEVPVGAVFAAAPTPMHQLPFFGRMRAVGYEGHLWSHGIDARDAVAKLNRIMAGDPDTIRLARDLGVTHIFWGPQEKLQYGDVDLPWMHVLPNVSRVPGFAIYAIK